MSGEPTPPDSDRLEHQLEEAVTLRQDYETSSTKLKALEKQVKALRQEREETQKVWPYRRCLRCTLPLPRGDLWFHPVSLPHV